MAKNSKTDTIHNLSTYSEEIVEKICNLIADGNALHQITEMEGMPKKTAIYSWLEKYPSFAEKYARAREKQADLFAAQIVTIADRATDANIARLQMDARKWAASKLAPKKYGDRTITELTGADGGAIKTEATSKVDWRDLDPDQREVIRQALISAKGAAK
jgi:hypothetical protein